MTMIRPLLYIIGLGASFALGVAFGLNRSTTDTLLVGIRHRPAYLLASWDVLHPDQMKPFADVVIPLANKAGMEGLAGSDPEVLEGTWPYTGVLILQRYESMQALLHFWRSPENAAAQKLREGHVNSHFIVAVEAQK